MPNNPHPPRRLNLSPWAGIFALLAAALTIGCVSIGDATTAVPRARTAPDNFDRINCEEIAGTAFRSDAERAWYGENCSRWPLVNVPEPRGGTSNVAAQPAECAAMRGRPYTSEQQRQWYLQNCQGGQLQGGGAQPGAGDRTNCDEIRGTAYRSSGERDWFLKNCPASGGTAAQTTSGPDRTNCNEIRGSAYRSNNERDWFVRNCSGATSASGGGQTQQLIIINPSPGNSSSNGRGRD